MPDLKTHLAVGERVFPRVGRFSTNEYGAFLLGCLLVDVDYFMAIERKETHFAERSEDSRPDGYTHSCLNFVCRLGEVLCRPWEELGPCEQAFVVGYLCHLAADEAWKAIKVSLGLGGEDKLQAEASLPRDVVLTALSCLSQAGFVDFRKMHEAMRQAAIPGVFRHVPHDRFQYMWDVLCEPLREEGGEWYFDMLRRHQLPEEELKAIRGRHERSWAKVMAHLVKQDASRRVVEAAALRSFSAIDLLFERQGVSCGAS